MTRGGPTWGYTGEGGGSQPWDKKAYEETKANVPRARAGAEVRGRYWGRGRAIIGARPRAAVTATGIPTDARAHGLHRLDQGHELQHRGDGRSGAVGVPEATERIGTSLMKRMAISVSSATAQRRGRPHALAEGVLHERPHTRRDQTEVRDRRVLQRLRRGHRHSPCQQVLRHLVVHPVVEQRAQREMPPRRPSCGRRRPARWPKSVPGQARCSAPPARGSASSCRCRVPRGHRDRHLPVRGLRAGGAQQERSPRRGRPRPAPGRSSSLADLLIRRLVNREAMPRASTVGRRRPAGGVLSGQLETRRGMWVWLDGALTVSEARHASDRPVAER